MKNLLIVLAVTVLGGCASYSKPGGNVYQAEFERRECAEKVQAQREYPTRADSFQPGGMDRSAARIERLQDACMAGAGYTRNG